jgi:glycosyltransferase involved in cell wall biosynthesis
MQKLLYIAPHLSTGGLPQYLTKKIELLKDEFNIYLVEWVDCTGGKLVVQRNKIKNLLPESKFYTLYEDKTELFSIINKIQPDIIHLEEIPEMFMDTKVAEFIYDPRRKYKIVETSHDSSYDTTQKTFFPDKFMFVSDWQINQYKDINIPSVLVEYPIEYIGRPDRTEALNKLGLDPEYKHVLHIGLFTPRKNQKEFFEYARALKDEKIIFHCVGNQADNFKWYWEPLMQDKPENVVWWNERTDVENFYQAMDLFLFTSRGTNNDKETMPLVIREAISNQIPILIYNLPVYLNYFNKFDKISYLNFNNFKSNCNKILSMLGVGKTILNKEEEVFVISTYPKSVTVIDSTKQCIEAIKKTGRKVILTSHIPVPKELSNIADYVVSDNNNILTKHSYYCNYWSDYPEAKIHVNLRGNDNDVYHGPTVYSNYSNGAALAFGLGFKKAFFLNYDYILKNEEFINEVSKELETSDLYFGKYQAYEGPCLYTFFYAATPGPFINVIPNIYDADDYNKLQSSWGSESNGLENIFYHAFKNTEDIYYEDGDEFNRKVEKTFYHTDFSRVEYFTILPTNIPDTFAPFIRISNSKEDKEIRLSIYDKEGKEINYEWISVNGKVDFYKVYPYEEGLTVVFTVYDNGDLSEKKTFKVENLQNNGLLEIKNLKPKIKLMHLTTEPETNPKEIRSVENIKAFCNEMGIDYDLRINKIWTEMPPKDICNRPDVVQEKPGYYKLAAGHYGCYLAHKNAICDEDNVNYDYVLIVEGDVVIDSDWVELYESLKRFATISAEKDMDVIGFGNPWQDRNLNGGKYKDIFLDVTPFIPAQSYLITKDKVAKIKQLLETTPWDAIDLWMCNVARLRIGTADKIYTKHLPGFSIIEQTIKDANTDNPLIFLQ